MSIRHRMLSNLTEFIAAIVIAALIVVVPAPLLAQQSAAAPKAAAKAVAQTEEDESPAAQKPGGEGIKVHGHWIIDVKDKDGKIVEHRDFQNALQTQGSTLLGGLLVGQLVPDQSLYVVVGGGTKDGYQMNGANSIAAGACSIPTANHCLTNLTQQPVSNGLVLSSQFQATAADTFTFVSTNLWVCYSYVAGNSLATSPTAPSACKAGFSTTPPGSGPYTTSSSQNFTSKDLTAAPSTPLSVSAGQTVQVSVTITFS